MTKRERFEKIAGRRVQAIIDKLDQLANCSNRNNYEYTDSDVTKMYSAIKDAVRQSETKFNQEIAKKKKRTFEF